MSRNTMPELEPLSPLFDEFPSVGTEEWKQTVREEFGPSSVEKFLEWTSIEGVSIPAYLHREALDEVPHVNTDPESSPLARTGDNAPNEWDVCQIIAHPNPETANEHAKAAIQGGADALRLMLSAPSSADLGVALDAVEDLERVLEEIDLNSTGLHLDGGVGALVLYVALDQHLSGNPDLPSLEGSVAYDPVAALAAGRIRDPDTAFSLANELRADAESATSLRTAALDARVYHNAGASAVQELTFTLGALSERLARAREHDSSLSTVLDSLTVLVSVSTSYFVEIAKLRALRLLVPQVVNPYRSDQANPPLFSPSDVHVQAETSRRTETLYDPHSNMLRASTEALAATAGGCDALSIRPYDASLRPPDPFGSRIARNTQLVLRHEAHLDRVADPAAGSYYVEFLTDKLARRAWQRFQELEDAGGILAGLQAGTVQDDIAETRRKRESALDERDHILVGATHYPALDERHSEVFPWEMNGAPSSPEPSPALDLSSLTAIREALRDRVPFSNIVSTLQSGSPAVDPLPSIRLAADIESVRRRTDSYAESHDGPPTVMLIPMDPPSARSARATFARNFLGVAGVEIHEPLKFDTVDDAADAAVDAGADAVVLCSSNDEYGTLVPAVHTALADRDHEALLVVAGDPDEIDAGEIADLFIHQGRPLKDTLETLQAHLGLSPNSPAE